MQRIDESPALRTGGSPRPAMLLALAIGVAIGACLSGRPARSAEAEAGAVVAPSTKPLSEEFGPPKPVRVVPVPIPPAATPVVAPTAKPLARALSRYSGDERYQRCLDASDGTNTAWSECGNALIEREDARLNEAWSQVYTTGSEAKSQELLAEQRAWLAFKEVSCTIYLSGRFGREGQVLSYPVCRAGIIAERTAALDAYGDPEGR